jgi:hypothetical protein
MFGLAEKVEKEKEQVTLRLVPCHFQGDLLELFGEVRTWPFGSINLTGQWKRIGQ